MNKDHVGSGPAPLQAMTSRCSRPLSVTSHIFIAALALRLILIAYGEWQDKNMLVKYTDVDYWVFTDAACSVAAGGSPFDRATYRYTPLLAWLLLPNCWVQKFWGKLIFSGCDLVAGYLIFKILVKHYGIESWRALKISSFAWLFNPMIFTISTRGNAESLLCCLILGTLFYILQGNLLIAGVIFGQAVHLKLFPAIFSFSFIHFIWHESWLNGYTKLPPANSNEVYEPESPLKPTALQKSRSQSRLIYTSAGSLRLRNFNNLFRKSWHLVRFALYSLISFGASTIPMIKIYGEKYIHEGFLYHLVRKDHRHNFSPYFLPFYLENVARLPEGTNLAVFIPQILLMISIGYRFGRKQLPFACFLQTFVFVTFNKVCTSQYFLWYLCQLPFVYVSCKGLVTRNWISMAVLWFGAQGIWLKFAYDLEFLGRSVYIAVWISSLLFMLVNTFIAHNLIKHHT